MYATERRERIMAELRATGRVSVAALAELLGVTSETVRRDLDRLESAGRIQRVHGGAVDAGRGSMHETDVAERERRNLEAKRRIARAALALIPDGFRGSILFDAGSTTAQLAALLSGRTAARRLVCISNSAPIVALLAAEGTVRVVALGGRVRGVTRAAVGPATIEQLRGMRPDLAFLGTNGISAGFGLSTPDADEAEVKRRMVRSARRAVVLADAAKFGQEALTGFAGLEEVDVLVTEAEPPEPLAVALREAEVEVVVGR